MNESKQERPTLPTFWMVFGVDDNFVSAPQKTYLAAQRIARAKAAEHPGRRYAILVAGESYMTTNPLICTKHEPIGGSDLPF